MSSYKIITTDSAKTDIKSISAYIAKDNIRAAIAIIKLFKDSVEKLSDFPALGKHKEGIKDKDIFIYTVKQRYSIAYKIVGNKIIILRILSNYQDIFAIL